MKFRAITAHTPVINVGTRIDRRRTNDYGVLFEFLASLASRCG